MDKVLGIQTMQPTALEFGKKLAPEGTRWQPLPTCQAREQRGIQKVRVTQKAREAEQPLQSTRKLHWTLIVPRRSLLGKMTVHNKCMRKRGLGRFHKQGGA